MSRIAYVNGRYVAHAAASVHVEDRGYQFADGIYEVIAVHHGRLIDLAPHLVRLHRSLEALAIGPPVSDRVLTHVLHRVAALNRIRHGIVYLQITRGVAPRNHAFPSGARPNWVVTAARRKPLAAPGPGSGVRVVGIPDQRWVRRDIKSVSLLPNVLGKEIAARAGAYEAWQIDQDGTITEGTSSNAWIVTREGEIVTRAASAAILNGVTRLALLSVAAELRLRFVERSFTLEEAKDAAEAFITSTTSLAVPVIRIDETVIGDGRPGPVVLTLGAALLARYDTEALA